MKIEEDKKSNSLKIYKYYTYQFKAMELFFSIAFVNETRKKILAMNKFAAAKNDLTSRKVYQVIAVINLDEVKN